MNNKELTKVEMWNLLMDYEIASDETITVVTSINGYSMDTLNDILFAVTGYRDWEQFMEYEE